MSGYASTYILIGTDKPEVSVLDNTISCIKKRKINTLRETHFQKASEVSVKTKNPMFKASGSIESLKKQQTVKLAD